MTYLEKLKDPRWQKKRLKIFERDDFTCQFCGSKNKTLNIHHLSYKNGIEPWEYDDDLLITLCEQCHVDERDIRRDMENRLLAILAINKFSFIDIENLIEYVVINSNAKRDLQMFYEMNHKEAK